MGQKDQLKQRLSRLEEHLRQENPVLEKVVKSFRNLDRVSRRMGFLLPDQSYALRTPWWPLISILGTYSSGKSTFLNTYLGYRLQATGNQAVDDKFTVMCFTGQDEVHDLPGMALDSDPRFPLYRIGKAIEEVAPGEGQQVDAYVQLKTCPSSKLKGKILIDSPGFDADAQRTSTLRITDRIVDLSDLVLIFFDARHPESGSMRDTLSHLVQDTLQRRDANKFLFILNQIDMTAGEDNPEEVFAAWQRALAQSGLTAGRTFSIYDPGAAFPIEDESLRKRFSRKAEEDRLAIYQRMEQVQVERAYRIVGMLEESANHLEQTVVPAIAQFLRRWRRRVLFAEGTVVLLLAALFLGGTIWGGYWDGLRLQLGLPGWMTEPPWLYVVAGIVVLVLGWAHFSLRGRAARSVAEKMAAAVPDRERQNYLAAFTKNSKWWRSLFRNRPVGWGRRSKSALNRLRQDVKRYIQELNDSYAHPSGTRSAAAGTGGEESVAAQEESGSPEEALARES
jgi:hypothetical protein